MNPVNHPPQAIQPNSSKSSEATNLLLIALYLAQIVLLLPALALHFTGCAFKACFIGILSRLAQRQRSHQSVHQTA